MRRVLGAAGVVFAAVVAPAQTGYTPRRVVDGVAGGFTSIGSGLFDAPAVNAVGQVSFVARTASSYGVYRSDGQANTLIHSNTSSWSLYSGLSLSTAGAVNFYYNPSTTAGWASVHIGSGGTPAVVADGSQTGPYSNLGLMPGATPGAWWRSSATPPPTGTRCSPAPPGP